MKKVEVEKNNIIKNNNPAIWWISSVVLGVIAALLIGRLDYNNAWVAEVTFGLAIASFTVGVYKSMNKGRKLKELKQNSPE
jgi:hypothetical protein